MTNSPSTLFNRFKNLTTSIKYRRSLPQNHMVEDIFLVSYPKSGNTWIRFLIANAIKVHYQIEREINFFSIDDIIPAVQGFTNLKPQGPFGLTELSRIIKSHAAYNPYYYRTILIVRDPRDVMVSYYYYLKSCCRITENYPLTDFIHHETYGVDAWVNHTTSWFYTVKPGQIVQLFLYEEFIQEPVKQLGQLMNLIGLKIEESNLVKAIELSSKENMRKSFKQHTSTYLTQIYKGNFVRRAEVTKGQELCDEDKKIIEEKTKDIAKIIGYNY
ncbi:MAG: sulfotransferase domain-containing protein [Hydrococcus sp. RU_2_2]|nr:sulfotransferase domain-containing protein [Hydrococcus sp. RU_2_2]